MRVVAGACGEVDADLFVDASGGYRDTGKWRVEGSQLCVDWQRGSNVCNETRLKDGALYVKRSDSAEILMLMPD